MRIQESKRAKVQYAPSFWARAAARRQVQQTYGTTDAAHGGCSDVARSAPVLWRLPSRSPPPYTNIHQQQHAGQPASAAMHTVADSAATHNFGDRAASHRGRGSSLEEC